MKRSGNGLQTRPALIWILACSPPVTSDAVLDIHRQGPDPYRVLKSCLIMFRMSFRTPRI